MRENARKQGFGTRTGSILHASRVGGRRVTVWGKNAHTPTPTAVGTGTPIRTPCVYEYSGAP